MAMIYMTHPNIVSGDPTSKYLTMPFLQNWQNIFICAFRKGKLSKGITMETFLYLNLKQIKLLLSPKNIECFVGNKGKLVIYKDIEN